jgi:hypothetical protein
VSSEAVTPDSFEEVVLAVTARAKAALPEAASRIDTAAALVLAGEVELLEEGRTARVGRCADGDAASVVHGQCSCPDFLTAPGHFCTHRLAYSIAKRATELSLANPTPLTTPRDQVAGGLCDTFDGNLEEVTEEDPRALGCPPELRETANLPPGTDLPTQYMQLIDGQPFVKYAGLLTMAHAQGLQQLEARFTEVSETLAVAQATATFMDGRRFTESGEATPENVGSKVRPHFARLALTRAKARCLRDALNIGLCAVEELGGNFSDGVLRHPPGRDDGRESSWRG